MGRLDNYNFNHDIELNNFKDAVRRIINFGKYATPVITVPPDWSGQPGETVFLRPTTGGTTFYLYAGSAWTALLSV